MHGHRVGSINSYHFQTLALTKLFFQAKYQQVQEALGEVQKQLEEAQQKSQLVNLEEKHAGGGEQPGTLGVGHWLVKHLFTQFVCTLNMH